jgi:hypothetical protein
MRKALIVILFIIVVAIISIIAFQFGKLSQDDVVEEREIIREEPRHEEVPREESKEEKPSIPSNLKYTYDAKFEPPVGKVLHGMGQWPDGNKDYLSVLSKDNYPASELFYINVDDTPRGWQPELIEEFFKRMKAEGVIPHIDIHLRTNQPAGGVDSLPDPLYAIDDEYAAGPNPKIEKRIQDIIDIVKAHEDPVFVRIGGEFSGFWNGYHPYDFPKAFQKVVTAFRNAGVDNAAFIWCYEPVAPDNFDECDSKGCKWFPGDEYIDWYGLDVFNSWEFSSVEDDRNPLYAQRYQNSLKFLEMAKDHNKPVILAETSARDPVLTSSQADGVNDWNSWFVPFFKFIENNPQIKAFHYINVDWTKKGAYGAKGWNNANIKVNSYITEQYNKELKKSKYLHVDEVHLIKDYYG